VGSLKGKLVIGDMEIPLSLGHTLSPTRMYGGDPRVFEVINEMEIYATGALFNEADIRKLLLLLGEKDDFVVRVGR
jgi:hypothetical protein